MYNSLIVTQVKKSNRPGREPAIAKIDSLITYMPLKTGNPYIGPFTYTNRRIREDLEIDRTVGGCIRMIHS